MKVESESEVAQLCLTPSDPMDCSPPGSSVRGIFQARVREWAATSFAFCRFFYKAYFLVPPCLGARHQATCPQRPFLLQPHSSPSGCGLFPQVDSHPLPGPDSLRGLSRVTRPLNDGKDSKPELQSALRVPLGGLPVKSPSANHKVSDCCTKQL